MMLHAYGSVPSHAYGFPNAKGPRRWLDLRAQEVGRSFWRCHPHSDRGNPWHRAALGVACWCKCCHNRSWCKCHMLHHAAPHCCNFRYHTGPVDIPWFSALSKNSGWIFAGHLVGLNPFCTLPDAVRYSLNKNLFSYLLFFDALLCSAKILHPLHRRQDPKPPSPRIHQRTPTRH